MNGDKDHEILIEIKTTLQMFMKQYYHKDCPGPPEETDNMTKALKGWKKGRKK